ncbi:TM2 domain-containing protein [Sediminibacterium sp.]|jgi:TM2 domain-containing membrane protein YozV|uniref:TM2 domain-containing protein n=1 Tax=Sediminibacterium sp. TaxID=1917865 RepID=UPI0025EF28B2|nr:TM2 domain-containing protein [Sediminibacterium sp.]
MQKTKLLLTGLLMLVLTVTLTSSVPIKDSKMEDLKAKQAKATLLINEATKDGKTLTSKELISIASEVKGEKLSFKEKIALKVFNKKIAALGADSTNNAGGKSQVVALILVLLVGGLGIHRFYLGYTWQGVVQLLTLGGCGIWTLIDLIRIITGGLTPKDGAYGTTL